MITLAQVVSVGNVLPMVLHPTMSAAVEIRRQLLLHLKCLVWCLHQMRTRYDLNLVLYSLEHQAIHPEIRDSNLGDNLSFLFEHLHPEDLEPLSHAIHHLPETAGSVEIAGQHFEIGHYIQAGEDFGRVVEGSYGIVSMVSPELCGLFYTEGGHLVESPFDPAAIRTIFGTYII